MTTTQKIQKKLNDSKAMRWSALFIVSFTMMIAYFFTDVMGPLETPLTTKGSVVYFEDGTYLSADSLSKIAVTSVDTENINAGDEYQIKYSDNNNNLIEKNCVVKTTIKGLGWGSDDYGIFSGAYGYINVFLLMLFFGGLILDKMGVRFTGLMSTGLMFLGAAIKWYAVSSFEGELFGLPTQVVVACLGFAIYGVGAEIAGITVTKVIAKWFTGHELALAMGLQVALARIGTACALFFSLPIAQAFGIVASPVLFGASALCIGMLSYIVYCVMDKKLDASSIQQTDSAGEEQFKLSDLKVIFCNKGFWLITLLCLMFYSAVFPFLKFATNLMIIKYNVNPELAGGIPGILPFGTILLTPLFGSLYDKVGKGATLMICGSVLLTIVHILFAMPLLNEGWFAVIVMVLLGIAFSLVPSAMWPSVPKIIDEKILGSAYCVIFWVQNIGLFLVPLLIGSVLESTGGYLAPMIIFSSFGILAFIMSIFLKVEDRKKGYGLEEPNVKK